MLRALWAPLRLPTRLGLGFVGAGVVADVVHHVFAHDRYPTVVFDIGAIGHVLTLAGMVLAVGGVIHAAAQARRRAQEEGERHAARSSSAAAR